MKTTLAIMVIALCVQTRVDAAEKAESSQQEKLDSKRLRLVLPKMLQSSDTKLVHEALVIIREDAIRNRKLSDELLEHVVATLRRLLRKRKREEAGTRDLACEVLWRARWKKAVPVLIEALDDPYEHIEFVTVEEGGAAHLEWYAVWRSADTALRNLTKSSPIDRPKQREPIPGQREKVRKAWLEWYEQHYEPEDSGNRE